MKSVIQIVEQAELLVDNKLISSIDKGLVVYFCVEKGDTLDDLNYFAKKIATMRIFADENDKTNLSIKDINGEILLISQFTLAGDYSKNRPDFTNAEKFDIAKEMYIKMQEKLINEYNIPVKMGVFGAKMLVKQTGLGPFTVFLENKNIKKSD